MAKKRKSENAGLDEVERTLYTSFCTAANSISQLYTQAQHQQKLAFQAGERHSVEKLYQRLLREHQAGSNISVAEILSYLQNELDGVSGDEMTMSPGPQFQHQQQQLVATGPAGVVGYPGPGRTAAEAATAPLDQSKISVFTGALSSPNRRCLPPFGMGYGSLTSSGHSGRRPGVGSEHHVEAVREEQQESAAPHYHDTTATAGFGFHPPLQQQQQGRDAHLFGESDASMDMHADGVADDYYR